MSLQGLLSILNKFSLPVKILLVTNILTLGIMIIPIVRVRYYRMKANYYIESYENIKEELEILKKKVKNIKRFGEESKEIILDQSSLEENNDILIPMPNVQ